MCPGNHEVGLKKQGFCNLASAIHLSRRLDSENNGGLRALKGSGVGYGERKACYYYLALCGVQPKTGPAISSPCV